MIKHPRFLLTFCAFLIGIGTNSMLVAQPVITQNDMPDPGDVINFSIADTLLQVSAGPGGANLSWDYRTLDPVAQQKDSFLTVPFAYRFLFGGADVAKYIPVPDSIGNISVDLSYQFFDKSSSKYVNEGTGFEISLSPIPIALRNDPEDVVYRFPLTYGNVDSSSSIATLDLSLFGIFYRTEQKRMNEVDAWGTLDTPYGTFQTVRVKTQIEAKDSIRFDTISFATNRPIQTNYKWLANGEKIPVLSMNHFRIGGEDRLISITYRDSVRNLTPTSIDNQLSPLKINMYPNPTSEKVNIELKSRLGSNAKLEIFDLQGRLIRQMPIDQNHFSISVRGLAKGTYVVRLHSAEGVFRGKLMVE